MRCEQDWPKTREEGGGQGEAGLTLVEIAIVLSILGILTSIVMISVRGSGNTARSTTKATDAVEVQKAVNSYHALHPKEKWPTLAKQVGTVTIEAGSAPTVAFSAADPRSFVAIDWGATFTTTLEGAKRLVPDFLRKPPKHGADVTLDADGDGLPEQASATPVWVIESGGVVRVLFGDAAY